MVFELCNDISIGDFLFEGVADVVIKKGIHGIADVAYIKLPHLVTIDDGKPTGDLLTAATLFADGDPVTISLGFDDGTGPDMHEEFKGFVKRRNVGMPLEIECEGYSYQLRNNIDVTGTLSITKASELLKLATGAGKIVNNKFVEIKRTATDVRFIVANDLELHGLSFSHNNGVEIIKFIKDASEGALTVFFINATTLWCGYPYTAYANGADPFDTGVVDYQLGYNCIKDNALREKTATEKTQVILNGLFANGHKVMAEGNYKTARNKLQAMVNRIQNEINLKQVAHEKEYRMNYEGYTGYITGWLQPYCQPGWSVNIYDDDLPERDGKYLVDSVTVRFGTGGARRSVGIGPRIGFKPNNL